MATATRYELRAGEPFVRVTLALDNPRDDQRVRTTLEFDAKSQSFIANLERCLYPLIQLQDDWEDADGGPFTAGILAALKTHYTEVPRQAEAHYRVPRPNCRAAGGGEIGPAQRLSRPDNRSFKVPASAGLVMR